ncbi:MAG: trigger factor [Acidobacteriota bacterium]
MALIEGCKHSLDITIPVEDIAQETERVAAKVQAKVRLPGFRPGKAPLSIVKTKFASEIRQDVIEALLPKFFHAEAAKENLQVVGQPNVKDLHFHDNEPLHFKAEFEVAPEVELGEYRGVTIHYSEPVVSEADIQERLDKVREQKAEYVNEEPRALVDGDYAVVSLESLSGVAEKISQDELMLQIGDESTLSAFSENLRGASPDDAREFDITYPEEYDRKHLAGRTVKFKAVVKAVRRRELPEANDEFAKDLGDFQTIDEFKETLRKGIFQEREQSAQEEAKNQILDRLVETHDFAVPDAYVDRQIEITVQNQLRSLAAQGIDPSQLKLDWAKVRETQKDRAIKDVKASLLLDKIGEKESIAATQDEVDQEVQRIAKQERETLALTRAKLQKDGTIGRIAGHIRTEKTLALLFEQARKEAVPPKTAE